MTSVFLLALRTSERTYPFAVFSTEEKAKAFAKYLVIDYQISKMTIDACRVEAE